MAENTGASRAKMRDHHDASRIAKYVERRKELPFNNDIKLEIEPYFLPDYTAPKDGLYTFGYKVTFTNTGEKPAYIRNRNWFVMDANGKNWDIFSPRVGGNASNEILPYGGTFDYKSAVPLTAPIGTLTGYFEGNDARDGSGKPFRTEEKVVSLSVPMADLTPCFLNHANVDFIQHALNMDAERQALETFLSGFERGEEVDTRTLTNISLSTRLGFERLLLQRLLDGLEDRELGLVDIDPSFPSSANISNMAFLTVGEKHGIRLLKQTTAPNAAPRRHLSIVVDNTKDNGKVHVEKYKKLPHNQEMLHRPKTGDAPWRQQLHGLIDKEGIEAVTTECTRYASARASASNQGMETCAKAQAKTKTPVEQGMGSAIAFLALILRRMKLSEQRAALDAYYKERTSWDAWRSKHGATPKQFSSWLDSWAKDRRELGLFLSDLYHLDDKAYVQIDNWKDPGSGVSEKEIASFGLPMKKAKKSRRAGVPLVLPPVVLSSAKNEAAPNNLKSPNPGALRQPSP